MKPVETAAVVLGVFFVCVANASDTTPKYPHLALNRDETQMVVSYYMSDEASSTGAQCGTSSGYYTMSYTGNQTHYHAFTGYNANVLMDGLEANSQYFCRAGSDDDGWTSEFNFTTPPAADSPHPFSLGMYGDMGIDESEDSMRLLAQMVADGTLQVVQHCGDLAYADDHLDVWGVYNDWMESMEPIFSYIPYMISPGNHEWHCFSPECAVLGGDVIIDIYLNRFRFPHNETGSPSNMFFSYDYSYAHVISLDSETNYDGAPYGTFEEYGDQLAWLEEDLIKANANRAERPWLIVSMHRPLYSSELGDGGRWDPTTNTTSGYATAIQDSFEDLFYEYGVDIVLSGHVHSYERTYPIYRDQVTSWDYDRPSSPLYLVSGAAGNVERFDAKYLDPSPVWSAYHNKDTYGVGVFDFFSPTEGRWRWMRSSDGAVLDTFNMTRGNFGSYSGSFFSGSASSTSG